MIATVPNFDLDAAQHQALNNYANNMLSLPNLNPNTVPDGVKDVINLYQNCHNTALNWQHNVEPMTINGAKSLNDYAKSSLTITDAMITASNLLQTADQATREQIAEHLTQMLGTLFDTAAANQTITTNILAALKPLVNEIGGELTLSQNVQVEMQKLMASAAASESQLPMIQNSINSTQDQINQLSKPWEFWKWDQYFKDLFNLKSNLENLSNEYNTLNSLVNQINMIHAFVGQQQAIVNGISSSSQLVLTNWEQMQGSWTLLSQEISAIRTGVLGLKGVTPTSEGWSAIANWKELFNIAMWTTIEQDSAKMLTTTI